jgi:hypothetical protein
VSLIAGWPTTILVNKTAMPNFPNSAFPANQSNNPLAIPHQIA